MGGGGFLLLCIAALLTACSGSAERVSPMSSPTGSAPATESAFINRLTQNGSGLVREVPAHGNLKQCSLTGFGKEQGFGLDLRWLDCKNDLDAKQQKKVHDSVPQITFNSDTVFPDAMPENYAPSAILEAGKNPGLGVRSLHKKGITGTGVGVAIIDSPLYTGHPEYKDQLALYEEIHVTPDEGASMHGSAVSSIAVGKTCGVAPGAKLYYWGVNFVKDSSVAFENEGIAYAEGLAVAVDRIIEVNKSLPKGEKIRVISISEGFLTRDDDGVQTFLAAVERAKKANIFVVTTTTYQSYDWLSKETDFGGLGKKDYAGDPDSLSNYTLPLRGQDKPEKYSSRLLVPMDARTTADFTGDGYAFFNEGGGSWVTPYVAGLYALACQVKPDVTPEEFYKTARKTADRLTVKIPAGKDAGKNIYNVNVISPTKLINALESDDDLRNK